MGGGRGAHDPVKFGKKYFSGSYYVKFGHFFGQKSCKLRDGSGKYIKNSGVLIIFGQE